MRITNGMPFRKSRCGLSFGLSPPPWQYGCSCCASTGCTGCVGHTGQTDGSLSDTSRYARMSNGQSGRHPAPQSDHCAACKCSVQPTGSRAIELDSLSRRKRLRRRCIMWHRRMPLLWNSTATCDASNECSQAAFANNLLCLGAQCFRPGNKLAADCKGDVRQYTYSVKLLRQQVCTESSRRVARRSRFRRRVEHSYPDRAFWQQEGIVNIVATSQLDFPLSANFHTRNSEPHPNLRGLL